MTLQDAIIHSGLTYRALAVKSGLSTPMLNRLALHGEYPKRMPPGDVQHRLLDVLRRNGLTGCDIEFPARSKRQRTTTPDNTEEIDLMQFDRTVMAHYGLQKNPFLNDVESDADVYQWKGHVQVATAIEDAIEQRGFLAITGPSGSGKTTIWDGIEASYGTREDTVICKVRLKDRERLSADHLSRALLYDLCGETTRIRLNAEDSGRQLSAALRSLQRKAVLLIDDAHFSSSNVLRQLKTFYEEKIGRYRLLAIILIGLPELKAKLSKFPEIGNRIRLVEVPPVPVRDYLDFKLRRVGSGIERIFDDSGIEALSERFRVARQKAAYGSPLEVNATAIRAMVKAHNLAQPRVTAEIIDQLPGTVEARRVAA
jgi:type II secretory pathway predicted ATPase ExeA